MDLAKPFPHLDDAPIVEAIIDWTARADAWLPADIISTLSNRLPDYPTVRQEQAITAEFLLGLAKSGGKLSSMQRDEWVALKCSNADGNQIAKFTRNGLRFSQLKPYPNWDRFESEARRVWNLFLEICQPSEVQRLGVRFVNAIPVPSVADLKRVLKEPPTQPLDLPLVTFTYQSRFDAPASGIAVNITKTIQEKKSDLALILDIDVFTKQPFICDESRLDELFKTMRHLKNCAFFSLLTDQAVEQFRGSGR